MDYIEIYSEIEDEEDFDFPWYFPVNYDDEEVENDWYCLTDEDDNEY